MSAFEKVGGIPQPEVTRFAVHASYILLHPVLTDPRRRLSRCVRFTGV
jgi:hypothetical protein